METFGIGVFFHCSLLIFSIVDQVNSLNCVSSEKNTPTCRPINITSSLVKRIFPPDIIKLDNTNELKNSINTTCNNFSLHKKYKDKVLFKFHFYNRNVSDRNFTIDNTTYMNCIILQASSEIKRTKLLTIKNTIVTSIEPYAFNKWTFIEKLYIISNKNLTYIRGNAFESLTNVWELKIIDNEKFSTFSDDSLKGLINLKALYLKKNSITDISKISKALSKKYLPKLIYLNLSGNKILTIGKNDFKPMKGSNLYGLVISQTATDYIHPDALEPFGKSIATLQLNQLNVNKSVLLEFIKKSVRNTNLNGISLKEDFLYGSPRELMEAMADSMRMLDLGSNHFGLITPGFFPVMHELKYLDLSNVMMDQIPENVINATVFPKLIHLYLKDNPFTRLTTAMITPKLRRLIVNSSPNDMGDENEADFIIDEAVLKNMPELELLDLSGKRLNKITPDVFKDATELKVLLLHDTSLTEIKNKSFENNKLLYYLDLSNNMFPMVSSLNGFIFYGLENLLALDLSSCYIDFIKPDLFKHIPNLQYLSLRRNPISKLSSNLFAFVPDLKEIDLRYNIIVSWNDEIFTKKHCISRLMLNYNSIMTLSEAMLNDFIKVNDLNLYANSITCNCEFYKSIKSLRVDLKRSLLLHKTLCSYPSDINSSLYEYLQKPYCSLCKCNDRIIVESLLGGLVALIAVIVLIPFYFKYKYEVQYRLLKLKKKMGIVNLYRVKKGTNNRGYFQYDAFVSYSNQDSNFVEKMIIILEKDDSKYKLCVFERDFQPGDNIVDRIIECMDVSIVTILVLTEAFVRSEWCRWEMSIAQNRIISQHFHKDSLILIIKSRIPESLITPTLKYLMDTRVYLEWQENSSARQNIFWEKLKDALKEKIQEPKMPIPNLIPQLCNQADRTDETTA